MEIGIPLAAVMCWREQSTHLTDLFYELHYPSHLYLKRYKLPVIKQQKNFFSLSDLLFNVLQPPLDPGEGNFP